MPEATPAPAPAPTQETPPAVTPPVAPPPPPNPAASAKPAPAPAPEKPAAKEAHEAFLEREIDENDPLWKGGHTGLPTFDQILEVTSEPGRKFLANVRADYSRKTAELAREREAARNALAEERATLAAERERLARFATPQFQEHLNQLAAAGKDADPFTTEGQERIAEAKAAALFEKMIAPIREEAEQNARRAQYKAYIAANPDFEQPETRKGVMAILTAKSHLSLEEAHDLWRGQRAREEAARLKTQQSAQDAERAKTLKMTGSGGLANTETAAVPSFKNASEALKYHQARGMK